MTAPRRPTMCLIVFCLLLWLPGFFTIPTSDRDEGRFAQATKQMLETGDFVNIRFGTVARNRKPVGIHWLQIPFAAAARAAGIATENPVWPYRIPSALGALVAVLGVFHLGRRLAGDGAAFAAAAMLAASILLIAETHFAKTDAALLGLTTVAMLLLARAYLDPRGFAWRHAAAFWITMGGAILIKGPVSPMIAGLTMLALVIADRQGAWLRALRAQWGVPLMLLMTLPWFIAIGVATQGQFFRDAVGGDLGNKLAGGAESHWGPPGLYLLLSPALLFPGTVVVLLAIRTTWHERAEKLTRFLIAWVVPAWIIFEVVPTKLPHYILPLFPALFLLAGRWIVKSPPAAVPRRWTHFSVSAGLVVAVLAGLAGLALPIVLKMEVWRGVPVLVSALVLFLLGLDAARRADWRRLRWMVLAMPLLSWSVLEVLLPAMRPIWLSSQVASALATHYPAGRPKGSFGTLGFAEPSLIFLAGTDTVLLRLRDPTASAQFLAAAPDRTVLVVGRERPAFLRAAETAGLNARPLAEIAGFNYAGGRPERLTLFGR